MAAIDYERLKKLNPAIVKALHQEISAKHRAFENAIYKPTESLKQRMVIMELQLPIIKRILDLMHKMDTVYNEAIIPLYEVRRANETGMLNLAEDLKNRVEMLQSYLADYKNEISEIEETINSLREEDPKMAEYLNGLLSYLSQQIDYLEKTVVTGETLQ
jgi:anion-transporting  ArsA/GET3 family ATPase